MPDIRSNFAEPAVLAPQAFEWVASPGGEVQRVMLDRVGDEVAIATSLVRYPADARFPAHEHALGEEFLVLEGEFGDETGLFPAGTYVRNPPGSRHTPFSNPGCVIWVKLRQFHPEDGERVVRQAKPPARARRELHRFRDEVVTAIAASEGDVVHLPALDAVQEVLVPEGAVTWAGTRLGRWGWLRVPVGEALRLQVDEAGWLLHKSRPAYAVPEGFR